MDGSRAPSISYLLSGTPLEARVLAIREGPPLLLWEAHDVLSTLDPSLHQQFPGLVGGGANGGLSGSYWGANGRAKDGVAPAWSSGRRKQKAAPLLPCPPSAPGSLLLPVLG